MLYQDLTLIWLALCPPTLFRNTSYQLRILHFKSTETTLFSSWCITLNTGIKMDTVCLFSDYQIIQIQQYILHYLNFLSVALCIVITFIIIILHCLLSYWLNFKLCWSKNKSIWNIHTSESLLDYTCILKPTRFSLFKISYQFGVFLKTVP